MSRPWTPGPNDRITAVDGDIDEIVLTGVALHLERMEDRRYYLGIYGDFEAGESGLLVQASLAVATGRKKRATAYLYHLDAPDGLPVDPGAWIKP